MKPIMLMIIFAFTVLITTFTDCTEIKKNSILNENLNGGNLAEHTSRIQKRSFLKLFGLKPRYRPVQISLNWRETNQQRLTKNNYYCCNREIVNTRPSIFNIQKNFFFFNGLNDPNNQHNPEINLSTTPKYLTTTESVLENKFTTRIEDTFTKTTMKPTESTLTTRFVTSTETTTETTKNVVNTKTTQMDRITTSTTSKPQTEKPINVMTTTEPTVNKINTESIKGGFTSTSMPQNNQYSELIYDIDPRYRK